MRLFRHRLTSS
ncbi:hypothetical protein E2C01_078437 [Portunus trituberculatus]|uniref:Uncharacterized protein n=1 Tax=Portunus trituberculatus TaxID=210409 RepID=A0A5B7IEA7_PORTR|nr:hypothetical protein [Portunus trituberculatus]